MPIPINLDRYAPQGQPGGGASSIASAQLFQTGMFAARAMSQSGQAMQGAMGDLATGLRDVSGAVKAYQKERDDAMTLADASGAAAFLSGNLNSGELEISQATSKDQIDRIVQNRKAAVSDYVTGKSASDTPNLRTDGARREIAPRVQMHDVGLTDIAEKRKAALTRADDTAKYESIIEKAREDYSDNPELSKQTVVNAFDNMERSGLVLPGADRAAKQAAAFKAMAIYRLDGVHSAMAVAPDAKSLKDSHEAFRVFVASDEGGSLSHNEAAELRAKEARTYKAREGELLGMQREAEKDQSLGILSQQSTLFVDRIKTGTMSADGAAKLEGDLDLAAKAPGLTPEGKERLLRIKQNFLAIRAKDEGDTNVEVKKQDKAFYDNGAETHKLALAQVRYELARFPERATEIKTSALELGMEIQQDFADGFLAKDDAATLLNEYDGIIKGVQNPAKLNPQHAEIMDFINNEANLGSFQPTTFNGEKIADATGDKRTAAMKRLTGTQSREFAAREARVKVAAVKFADRWMANPKTNGLPMEKFQAAYSEFMSREMTDFIFSRSLQQ
jgi:hypothetical protein